MILVLRSAVKSFFVSNFINALFVLRNRKFLQSLIDKRLDLYVVKMISPTKRSQFFQYFAASGVIYYTNFLILLVIYLYVNPPQFTFGSISTPNSGGTFSFWTFFNNVLKNNLNLDISEYMLGGVPIFIGTFVYLFSSNIIETAGIASLSIGPHSNTLTKYILPQFFPETFGYVFGIAIAMVISDIIFSFFQSMLLNQKSFHFFNRSKDLLTNAGYYLVLSISLLIIGAIIESSLGIFHF